MPHAEYATVYAVRSAYIDATSTDDDALILAMIRQASREIERVAKRKFYPAYGERQFNTPAGRELLLDADLLALVTLTNGDGAAFESGEYRLWPYNETPKLSIQVPATGSRQWQTNGGDSEAAIAVLGEWGHHPDWDNAWEDTGAVLAAGINSSASTFTCTTGLIKAGDLLGFQSECVYAVSVTTGATDTVSCVRGANGYPTASHSTNMPIYRYAPSPEIVMLCERATAAYYRLRANPLGDTVIIAGTTFQTPKDVTAYITKNLQQLGLVREAFA